MLIVKAGAVSPMVNLLAARKEGYERDQKAIADEIARREKNSVPLDDLVALPDWDDVADVVHSVVGDAKARFRILSEQDYVDATREDDGGLALYLASVVALDGVTVWDSEGPRAAKPEDMQGEPNFVALCAAVARSAHLVPLARASLFGQPVRPT